MNRSTILYLFVFAQLAGCSTMPEQATKSSFHSCTLGGDGVDAGSWYECYVEAGDTCGNLGYVVNGRDEHQERYANYESVCDDNNNCFDQCPSLVSCYYNYNVRTFDYTCGNGDDNGK